MAETWWHKTHNNENKGQSHYEALIEHFRKKDLTLFQQKFTRFLTCLVPEKMWRTLQSEKTKTNNNPPLTAMQLSSLVPQFLILQNSPKYPFLPYIFSATIQRNRKERKKGIKNVKVGSVEFLRLECKNNFVRTESLGAKTFHSQVPQIFLATKQNKNQSNPGKHTEIIKWNSKFLNLSISLTLCCNYCLNLTL